MKRKEFKIFSDKKFYRLIDIDISLTRINEKRALNLLKSINFKDASKILRKGIRIKLKKYLIGLALRFKLREVLFILKLCLCERKRR